jgi:uncharacterized protein YcfL
LLGFDKNSSNSFVANVLTSDNVINLQKESTLYIHSDLVNNDDDNVLQDIFTSNSSDYGRITYVNPDIRLNSKRITTIDNVYRFYLTDENGLDINLNGLNWQMTLVLFNEVKKVASSDSTRTNEMIRNYIKFKVS